jgi:CPA1 family monovalent cation:H+ antiporter
MDLSASLLEISILLAGAVFIGVVARRFNIPVTVVLALGGFLVAWAGGAATLDMVESLKGEAFEETVINLFLPILIFEAVLNLSTRHFLRNLAPILVLATVALGIAATLVGVTLYYGLGVPLAAALLFGVLISATDPVAVIAVFRGVGVPRRLLTLVEGESLLNDGVAIVGFNILLGIALGSSITFWEGLAEFAVVFIGGAAIGALIGLAAALVLPMLDRLSAATLSLGVAYGSFVLADAVFDVSGVMATAAAGLLIGGFAPSRGSEPVRQLLENLWDALAYVANALLFLFIGLVIDPASIGDNLDAIGIAIATVLIARPVAILPLVSALERFAGIREVGRRNAGVLVWGGLRGGVALALALALPTDLPERDLFIAMTGGVVLTTLLFNATTISTLVHRLGLDTPSLSEQFLQASARLLAIEEARASLTDLGYTDKIVAARLNVAEMEARDLLERISLAPNDELEVYTLRGLHVERRVYQTLSDAGLLRPIATRTLMQEIDDEIDEIAMGELAVDTARRGVRPWYAQAVRKLLGWLPEPAGEDLTEVAYSEVSARRLGAQRASAELDLFKRLPNCDQSMVDKAKETFAHWEESATKALNELAEEVGVDTRMMMRRHAETLSRVASVEAVMELVDIGLLSQSSADSALQAIVSEVVRPENW